MAIDERMTGELSPAVPARPMAGTRSLTVHVVLLAATFLSATLAGVGDPRELAAHPAIFLRGLPFAATLVTILLVHELGHYLTCHRHRVSASLPYFLPAPLISPVGTFGAVGFKRGAWRDVGWWQRPLVAPPVTPAEPAAWDPMG